MKITMCKQTLGYLCLSDLVYFLYVLPPAELSCCCSLTAKHMRNEWWWYPGDGAGDLLYSAYSGSFLLYRNRSLLSLFQQVVGCQHTCIQKGAYELGWNTSVLLSLFWHSPFCQYHWSHVHHGDDLAFGHPTRRRTGAGTHVSSFLTLSHPFFHWTHVLHFLHFHKYYSRLALAIQSFTLQLILIFPTAMSNSFSTHGITQLESLAQVKYTPVSIYMFFPGKRWRLDAWQGCITSCLYFVPTWTHPPDRQLFFNEYISFQCRITVAWV